MVPMPPSTWVASWRVIVPAGISHAAASHSQAAPVDFGLQHDLIVHRGTSEREHENLVIQLGNQIDRWRSVTDLGCSLYQLFIRPSLDA